MDKRFIVIAIVLDILILLATADVFGFGSNYTHPAITRAAVGKVVENGTLDRYLREDLEIREGINQPLSFYREISGAPPEEEIERNNDVLGESLRRRYPTRFEKPYSAGYLIVSGSEAEDHPTERAQHHFLDPLSNRGLDNNYYGAGVLADFLALFYPPAEQGNAGRFLCSLVSLCEPAFNLDGTSAVDRVEGKTSGAYPHNYFAWPDTRQYFYNALTARTKEEREHYFALTFFSLGHNLHILEDMGVPAHTRNDFLYDHIWHGLIKGSYLEGYLESGKMIEKIAGQGDGVFFSRLADFWDNNGSQGLPGLSEYVNHNFLSEGTVFRNYEFPGWVDIKTYEIMAEDGQKDFVRFYTGRTSDGLEIPHLAAVGLLHSALGLLGYNDLARYTAYLDPHCYQDYSEIIIPKAVSYVSGLIEYFFRGRIGVIKEGLAGFRIKNLSAEPIAGGLFEIYYDSTDGIRNRLASKPVDPNFSLMPGAVTEKIAFIPPDDNIAPGRYIVVFRGRLGDEDQAVIGKVIREKVYFVSDRSGAPEIYSMNVDGSDPQVIVSNADPAMAFTHPVVSRDESMLAFHFNRSGNDEIWIGDMGTGSIRKIADGAWPDWSPDGSRLVYYRKTDGKGDIFIADIETLEEIRLTSDTYHNFWPAWSPDGSRIAYTSQRESKIDIMVIDLERQRVDNLTAFLDNRDRWKPAWSPDGQRIAYETPSKPFYAPDELMYVNIHALQIDTGTEINLTNSENAVTDYSIWNVSPHWIDNENIVIESNVSGESWSDLWVIDANGGGFVNRLTNTPGNDGYPFVW